MPTDKFYIGYTEGETGLNTYFEPYAIPDTAYAALNNAYVFRGRVRKRFGSRYLIDRLGTRLRIQIGSTTNAGTFGPNTVIVLTGNAPVVGAVGQAFSIGNVLFTVTSSAAGNQQMLRSDNSAAVATYDIGLTTINIAGAPASTAVFFYPGLPVMGLLDFETGDADGDFIVGFDTQFAYQYNNGWQRSALGAAAAVWSRSNVQFPWGYTYFGADPSMSVFFVVDGNLADTQYIRYLTGPNVPLGKVANTWYSLQPQLTNVTAGGHTTITYLDQAVIVVPFHNRLLFFNTWESETIDGVFQYQRNYPARCRYSQADADPTLTTSYQDIAGLGGSIDCTTADSITTVQFIKDRLIVFFDSSTWELVWTGNQAFPFVWQQINTELGAESTFSVVPFDKVAIAVGNVGIEACNGSNVERIDSSIPQTVFDIHNINAGVNRVYGIRDYNVEMVYWTFPNTLGDATFPYPDRVLVYNYKTGAWAFNDDSITCFGRYNPSNAITWDSTTVTWDSDVIWGGGQAQSQFPSTIAGNQEGYTFICDADETINAAVLQITNIVASGTNAQLTIINHNLQPQDYIYIQNAQWSDGSNSLNGFIYQVQAVYTAGVQDANNIIIIFNQNPPTVFTGTYLGGGVTGTVSQIEVRTKQYNFYAKQNRNAYVSRVDFMVDATPAGQMQADFYISTSPENILLSAENTGTLVGTGNLDTFPYVNPIPNPHLPVAAPINYEEYATRVWHPLYLQADGECIQLDLTMSQEQMLNINIWPCDFVLHAIIFNAIPTSSRLS